MAGRKLPSFLLDGGRCPEDVHLQVSCMRLEVVDQDLKALCSRRMKHLKSDGNMNIEMPQFATF